MFYHVEKVLNPGDLNQLRDRLLSGTFVDGRTTAGWNARIVKNNLQLEPHSKMAQNMMGMITQALMRHPTFEMAARPKLMRPLMIARYEPGMEYGWHVDEPLMGGPPSLRSDIAFTLFLNDPSEYDGGELMLKGASGDQSFKLAQGDLVLYPATTLHRVSPVTHGMRLVALSWVQSLVRDAAQREILYDLDLTRKELFEREGKSPSFDRLNHSFANLIRMWVEA